MAYGQTTRVIVESRFLQYEAEVERRIQRALGHAAGVGVAAARGTPTRYSIGSIIGSLRALPASPDRFLKGWTVSIIASDWRAIFFDLGTLGRRRRKLSPRTHRTLPPRTAGGTPRGVKAAYFLSRGLRAAKGQIIDMLRLELR